MYLLCFYRRVIGLLAVECQTGSNYNKVVKRGCWIAFWAVVAYTAACIGIRCTAEIAHALMANVKMSADVTEHIGLMELFARGLLPYVTASVVIGLGLGAHLPGTRMQTNQPAQQQRSILVFHFHAV